MVQGKVKEVEKIWLSSKEVQWYLGIGKDFLDNLRETGRIQYYKVGRTIFYRKTDIDKLIERNRVI